jgi:hypothetical protein
MAISLITPASLTVSSPPSGKEDHVTRKALWPFLSGKTRALGAVVAAVALVVTACTPTQTPSGSTPASFDTSTVFDGEPGKAGKQGPNGDAGATGPQGIQGLQGIPGVPGVPGIPGPKGATGSRGPQGNAGAIGPAGASGFAEVETVVFEPSYMRHGNFWSPIARFEAKPSDRLVFMNITLTFQLGFLADESSGGIVNKLVVAQCVVVAESGDDIGGGIEFSASIARIGDYLNQKQDSFSTISTVIPRNTKASIECRSESEVPRASNLYIWPTSATVINIASVTPGIAGVTAIRPGQDFFDGCLDGVLADCVEYWEFTNSDSEEEAFIEARIVELSLPGCQQNVLETCQILARFAPDPSAEKTFADAQVQALS